MSLYVYFPKRKKYSNFSQIHTWTCTCIQDDLMPNWGTFRNYSKCMLLACIENIYIRLNYKIVSGHTLPKLIAMCTFCLPHEGFYSETVKDYWIKKLTRSSNVGGKTTSEGYGLRQFTFYFMKLYNYVPWVCIKLVPCYTFIYNSIFLFVINICGAKVR